jgi:hypothetical protein
MASNDGILPPTCLFQFRETAFRDAYELTKFVNCNEMFWRFVVVHPDFTEQFARGALASSGNHLDIFCVDYDSSHNKSV